MNYSHQVCRWSVARGACPHRRAGRDAALPAAGHITSHILIVKITWVLSSDFIRKLLFIGKCWCEQNLGVLLGGTFLGTLLFCWNFSQGRLLHFTATVGRREGSDPAPSAPGASFHPACFQQELSLSQARHRETLEIRDPKVSSSKGQVEENRSIILEMS